MDQPSPAGPAPQEMPQNAAPDLEKAKRELEIEALREKTPLEFRKLNLEIDALSKSFRRTLATSIITAVVAVTVAGGGWFFDRMKTREANQEERFSKTWENFGSTNLVTRMAAISDLSSSARSEGAKRQQVIVALLNRLSVADEIAEMESIVGGLVMIGSPALSESVNANKKAKLAFARACGRYASALNSGSLKGPASTGSYRSSPFDSLTFVLNRVETPYDFEEVLRTGSGSVQAVFSETVFRLPYTHEFRFWEASKKSDSTKSDSALASQNSVIQKWQYLCATSLTISRILRQISGHASGLDISGAFLVAGDLRNIDLHGIVFKNGAIVSKNLESADFSCSDLRNTSLESTFFDNLKLRGAILQDARLPYFDTEKADLSGSTWQTATWTSENVTKGVFEVKKTPDWEAGRSKPYSPSECQKPSP
jgi:uncharacterized protein YjbI with pentapeptide repeats